MILLIKINEINNEEIIVVSSRDVAEDFERRHDNVVRDIEDLIQTMAELENSGHFTKICKYSEYPQKLGYSYFIQNKYKDSRGRFQKEYLITQDGFALLAMGFNGAKALHWKLKYIEAFNTMKGEVQKRYKERQRFEIARARGKETRQILTDVIKYKVPESPNKPFMYPNFTRLIYKVLFGLSISKLRRELKLQKTESIRDHLVVEELAEIENLERLTAGLINLGWCYDKIKRFLTDNVGESNKLRLK